MRNAAHRACERDLTVEAVPRRGAGATKRTMTKDAFGSIGGIGRVRLMFRSFERSANEAWKKLFTN
jgi:hypothetical protein